MKMHNLFRVVFSSLLLVAALMLLGGAFPAGAQVPEKTRVVTAVEKVVSQTAASRCVQNA